MYIILAIHLGAHIFNVERYVEAYSSRDSANRELLARLSSLRDNPGIGTTYLNFIDTPNTVRKHVHLISLWKYTCIFIESLVKENDIVSWWWGFNTKYKFFSACIRFPLCLRQYESHEKFDTFLQMRYILAFTWNLWKMHSRRFNTQF